MKWFLKYKGKQFDQGSIHKSAFGMRWTACLVFLPEIISLGSSEPYPTCGDCWCIPILNGLGPCPFWQPQTTFSDEVINEYLNQTILNPYLLDCNPYDDSNCSTTPPQDYLEVETAVCAFKYSDESCAEYNLITYQNRVTALQDHAIITHEGSCGLCSTAADLAVYLSKYTSHIL
jgi:hypothetical protein